MAICPQASLEIDKPVKSNKARATRVVYQGRYKGRPAIIKVFSQPQRKWLHWFVCHFHGRTLRRRGVPAPAIWYSGYVEPLAGYVIVYERLASGVDFYWIRAEPDRKRRLEGYMRLIPLFSHMHANGIAQKDTTPGNFIQSGGSVYAIDEDRMDIRPWPLGRRASLGNLASLFTQFAPEDQEDIDHLYADYMKARGWVANPRWRQYLDRRIRRFRSWRRDKRVYERKQNILIAAGAAFSVAAIAAAFWLLI